MKKTACFLTILLAFASSVYGQSLTIGSIPGTAFCAGDMVMIPYSATGSFTNRNSFIVQISSLDGTFDKTFTNAGSKRTAALSGLIPMVVPTDIPLGFKYRVRLVSSEPFVVSSNVSASDIGFGPAPNPFFEWTRDDHDLLFGLAGTSVQFNAPAGNTTVMWDFGPDAIPSVSAEMNPNVVFSTEGYKTVRLSAVGVAGCSKSASNEGLKNIYIGSCFPKIPKDAFVDSVQNFVVDRYAGAVWVVPGGRLNNFRGEKVFVEAGGTVDESEITTIYYMKAGSVLKDLWTGYVVVEPGVSMDDRDRTSDRLFTCSDLEFDYSDAPPYKIKPASVSRVSGSSIEVYPNPATERITVEHPESRISEISLRNLLGAEQVFVQPEGVGRTTIDVSNLAAGLYFIDILTNAGIETHKIVVTR